MTFQYVIRFSIGYRQDPDREIENSGKTFFKSRMRKLQQKLKVGYRSCNFCYIQVIVFDLSFLPISAVGTQQVRNRLHWQISKVKNYNLNVTKILHPTVKKSFPGIFNFTVWILTTGLCHLIICNLQICNPYWHNYRV